MNYRPAFPWESHVSISATPEFESPSDFLVKFVNRRFCSFYDAALTNLAEQVCFILYFISFLSFNFFFFIHIYLNPFIVIITFIIFH